MILNYQMCGHAAEGKSMLVYIFVHGQDVSPANDLMSNYYLLCPFQRIRAH